MIWIKSAIADSPENKLTVLDFCDSPIVVDPVSARVRIDGANHAKYTKSFCCRSVLQYVAPCASKRQFYR